MSGLIAYSFVCPVCGQAIETAADPSQGEVQQYVEDCQVCCRPLVLELRVDGEQVQVDARAE